MKSIFPTYRWPQSFTAVIFVFLALTCFAACSKTLVISDCKYGSEKTVHHQQQELELLALLDPLTYPRRSNSLYAAARSMADKGLRYCEKYPEEKFLESVLLNTGVYDRSATAYWHTGDPASAQARKWLKLTFLKLSEAGYHNFALAVQKNREHSIIAIVATQKNLFLELALPTNVKAGQKLDFKGNINEDMGMLKFIIMEPEGKIFEDFVPYLAGRFHYPLILEKKGQYKIEALNRGMDGDWRTLARFGFNVDKNEQFKSSVRLNRTSMESYAKDSLKWINGIRLRENTDRLNNFEFLEDILKESSAKEATAWPSSTNVSQHPLTINLKHKMDCIYISSFTKNLQTLISENLATPSYRKAVLNYAAFSHQAAVQKSFDGFRVSEMVCMPHTEQSSLLGRFPSARKQLEYHRLRQEKLSVLLGFNNGENIQQISDNWTLVQSIKLIDSLGGLSAILKGQMPVFSSKRSPLTNNALAPAQLLDEAFVSVWQSLQKQNVTLSKTDPESDALSLLLMQILLFQNRVTDYQAELDRMTENRNLTNLWLNARVELARAWLAVYKGDIPQSIKHMKKSMASYQSLKMDSTVENIARQRMILEQRLQRQTH